MTMHPSFADVTHPLFAQGPLLAGADRLFAALPDHLAKLSWNFWGTYDYCDQVNIDKHSDVKFEWKKRDEPPSQEDLDEIPAVRFIERTAGRVVDFLPILVSDDGNDGATLNGEVAFTMEPGRIEFSLMNDEEGYTITATAVHENGEWRNETLVTTDPQGCLTDIASLDHQAMFDASVDVSTMGLPETPTVLGVRLGTDGMADFILPDDVFDAFVDNEVDNDGW